MYEAIILPLAQQDIRRAANWYNTKRKELGRRFTAEVRKKVLFLRQLPEGAPVRFDNVRTAVIDVFPFMIHYTVDHEAQKIIIAAVFHTSQNPDIWRSR